MRNHLPRILIALIPLALLLLHAVGTWRIGLLGRLDNIYYDARLNLTMPRKPDERIVIIDIDEKSLAEVGRWPWSRNVLAQLVDTLFEKHQVALIGFDVVFAEPDTSSGLQQLEKLAERDFRDLPAFAAKVEELRASLDYDQLFARSLAKRPVILGYYFTSDRDGRKSGVLPKPAIKPELLAGRPIPFTEWDGYGSNLKQFVEQSAGAGFFNPLVDPGDGVVRAVPLIAKFEGQYYESLSLAMFRLLFGQPEIQPGFPQERFLSRNYLGLESIKLVQGGKSLAIPVDLNVAAMVPYRGLGGPKGGSFQYVSASDVLSGKVAAGALKGKIMLVGTTSPGLLDLRVTPVGEAYPGVEVHANLISGLLDGSIPIKPDYSLGYEVMLLLTIGLLLAFLLPRLSALNAVILTAGLLLLVLAQNWWLYTANGLVFPLASSVLLIFAIFALNMSYGYFVESRTKRKLTKLFGTYVPPELVVEMERDPDNYSMVAKSQELTVMFCDIKGFTTLSERMEPVALQALLNELFTAVTAVIQAHRGTTDKYIGDAAMAFWGAPFPLPNHAELAMKAALELQQAVAQVNRNHAAKGLPEVALCIGINTGLMCVGDMGSNIRKSYTVVGDAVNLGSRLEGLTRIYGVPIIVSNATRNSAKSSFEWRELDRVRVKGKADALRIFEPLAPGSLDDKAQQEMKLWAEALRLYRLQSWDQAENALMAAQRLHDRPLYRVFFERIQEFRRKPPPKDWDGAYNFDSK
jgi:adenylate cyclase